MAGVYIHIPFCKSFCTYCDFYSICDQRGIGRWLDSLFHEMEFRRHFLTACGHVIPSTLYLGGGTPSLLSPSQIGDIARRAETIFRGGRHFDEFTMEINPDDVSSEKAGGWKAAGVSRVSMGVQSFDDPALKWMNRRHNGTAALKAFDALREAGFSNISMDLIFGYLIPGETPAEGMKRWNCDLERVMSLKPEHISAYQMSIEPGSLLGQMKAEGKYREPEDSYCAEQYELLQKLLEEGGYEQYEISNFALKTDSEVSPFRSKHNSSYWTREPYIGLGPAAHSFCGRTRSWNPDDVEGYIEADGKISPESETLSEEEIEEEKIMLGLRTAEGVSALEAAGIGHGKLEEAVACGWLAFREGRYRIPSDKWFVSDDIIVNLLTK